MSARSLPAVAVRPLFVVAAARCALSLAVAGRYGWQRDELYYAVAGRHLQGGYVEFPPVTALFAAVSHFLFGYALIGLRVFTILAGAATIVLAALVARELGGDRRAQVIAAVAVGFAPVLLATNGLFQPVSFDQTATMLVLWLALRLALGRGSWIALGIAAGVGLETKYTLAVVLVLLVAAFAAWRRDALRSRGLPLALVLAGLLLVPNLVWEAGHGWVSVHWFLHPPPSATDETRPKFLLDLFLDSHPMGFALAIVGVAGLWLVRRARPLAVVIPATALLYFALGGKSYYPMPVVFFAIAAGAVPFERWVSRRWLLVLAAIFVGTSIYALPSELPVLPLQTAISRGVVAGRSDYQDELGWYALARQVEGLAHGSDVVIASNYGEAGALDLFGHGLPPVASGDVTFRYWRPDVPGRRALLVGRISMPTANQERGLPIARCTLNGSLAAVWPQIVPAG